MSSYLSQCQIYVTISNKCRNISMWNHCWKFIFAQMCMGTLLWIGPGTLPSQRRTALLSHNRNRKGIVLVSPTRTSVFQVPSRGTWGMHYIWWGPIYIAHLGTADDRDDNTRGCNIHLHTLYTQDPRILLVIFCFRSLPLLHKSCRQTTTSFFGTVPSESPPSTTSTHTTIYGLHLITSKIGVEHPSVGVKKHCLCE